MKNTLKILQIVFKIEAWLPPDSEQTTQEAEIQLLLNELKELL